ncbi:MBL fold metallo-hydrolase [Uliginosibacterium sp. 31-16]|uniref:MBL fold metallo-hydrolase n=1 Tax=Uliginosibacterium sp. 31-16 TaxID=3068315 RepID=UPI00273F3E2C|nr:MBL fold metallo-hydrolase [Uliginosibacterium sp. 31-16]MDP5240833.1 MBL fold metallo-hydrolase [Uliginosibacterium sp. 31-16]
MPHVRLKPRWLLLPLLLGTSIMAYSSIFEAAPDIQRERPSASHYANGQFHNLTQERGLNFADSLKGTWRYLTGKSPDASPGAALEVLPLSPADLQQAPDQSLWRLGHSTVLLKLEGKFWLTDPVFAERASPFSFAGPKRFHTTPIARDDLPPIEAVILSHDHYDHLDRESILSIADKVGMFVTPLGVGERLIGWGIPATKIQRLDWWEETQVGALRLIATPAQHFSGRSLTDRNSTLWASWVLIAPQSRVFFSGDSGYFDGFREIGERFGPFDLTLIENGAYNEAWADVHMQPEQSIQAHIDLKGKRLVPIHNGTFDLALHAWTEPLERITALAEQGGVALSTPRFGERLDIHTGNSTHAWWRQQPEDKAAQVQPRPRNPKLALIAPSAS